MEQGVDVLVRISNYAIESTGYYTFAIVVVLGFAYVLGKLFTRRPR